MESLSSDSLDTNVYHHSCVKEQYLSIHHDFLVYDNWLILIMFHGIHCNDGLELVFLKFMLVNGYQGFQVPLS